MPDTLIDVERMSKLRITVLGSGSVGLAVAATYAVAGADVTVLARAHVLQQFRQTGILVTGVSGEHHVEPNRLKFSDVDAPDLVDVACDVLIVATKAYQVRTALLSLMKRTKRKRPVSRPSESRAPFFHSRTPKATARSWPL